MKNKGLLKMLSALIAVAMVICAAPLNGFVGLEFPEIKISEMFDFGVNAVAAPVSYETIEENQTITVFASGYSQIYIKLVPKNTTTYTLVSVGNSDTYGFLYNENMEQLAYNDDGAGNGNFKIEYNLQAGETYYYGVRFYRSSYSGPINVKLTHACEHIVDDSGLKCETCGFEFLDIQIDMGQAKILGCSPLVSGDITIPSSYNGSPVILVAKNAFKNCTNITSVTIPESVITIESEAFYGCTALETITLPDTAVKIGKNAFANTPFFTNESNWENGALYIGSHLISTNNTIDSNYVIKAGTKTIAENAFYNNTQITSVTFPESMVRISKNAFYYCRKLTAASLNDGLQVIDTGAFYNCSSLSSVAFPDTVNRLGVNTLYNTAYYNNSSNWESDALYNGKHLIKVDSYASDGFIIREGTKTIAGRAFQNCDYIKTITIPDGVLYVGGYAFYDCNKLNTVVIPDTVVDLQGDAFYYCNSLKNVTLSNSLKQIRKNTFYHCDSLENIDIPDSIEYIGKYAFNSCYYLKTVSWSTSLKTIYDSAFYCCERLESIVLPEGLKEIKTYAFGDCESLKEISIPITVECIESNILCYCNSLTTLEIPFIGYQKNLPNNWRYLFGSNNYSGLKNVKITNAETISSDLFKNRTALEKVTLGDGVENIDSRAFSGCRSLSELVLGNGIKTIGSYAFENCSSLTSVVIPDSVEYIQDAAFYNCTSLKTVDLGNGTNMSMSYDIFSGCNNIERFTVGGNNANYSSDEKGVLYNKNKTGLIKYPSASSMTEYTIASTTAYINESAFEKSYSLKKVNFPENIMSIGNYAFRDCTVIEEVFIPDGASAICSNAFSGCSSIKKVILPESLIILGGKAFKNCVNLEEVIINCADLEDADSQPFYNCGTETDGITVVFTDKVKSIPYGMFKNYNYDSYGCKLKTLTIGKNVSFISEDTFKYCDELKEVNFNAVNCSCYGPIFEGCNSLEEINIGNGVQTIPSHFLQNNWTVDELIIPETVTCIGAEAFAGCTGIDEYNLPSSLKSIGRSAFNNCGWFDEIVIPAGVEEIGDFAFANCQNLDNIIFTGNDSIYLGANIFDYSPNVTICCKENSFMHSYAETNGIKYCIIDDANNPNYAIKNDVLISYEGEAESIYLNCVSKVGYGAFRSAYSLEHIELSNSVDRIFDKAFANCWSLQTIIIPKSVTSIGDNAFENVNNRVTIYCYADSYAETYAKEQGIKYEYITLGLTREKVEIYSDEVLNLGTSYNIDIIDKNEVIWSSDNESVVKVAQNGKITAVRAGKAVVKAETVDGLEAECVITVKSGKRPVSEVVGVSDFTLNYKGSVRVEPDIKLEDVAYTVEYSSSDPSVVTVDEDGYVTTTGIGEAEITVKITDEYGNVVENTCKVKVSYTWWQWILIIVLFGWIWY